MTTERKLVLVLLVMSLVIGLCASWQHRANGEGNLVGDEVNYHRLALSISSSFAYPSTFRPPGYPALVALIYKVAGPHLLAVYILQALMLTTTFLFVHKIAVKITENEHVAALTLALCVVWFPFYGFVTQILTEILAGLLIAAMIWGMYAAVEKTTLPRCVIVGLLIGVGALTKPIILPFAPIMAAVVLLNRREWRRNAAPATVLCLTAALLVCPWTVRNYRVIHAFVPVATGSGLDFYWGNRPDLYHMTDEEARRFIPMATDYSVEQDRQLMKQGMAYIREAPIRALGVFLLKFSALWLGGLGMDAILLPRGLPLPWGLRIPLMSVPYGLLLISAVAGWAWSTNDVRRRAYPVVLVLAVWTATYVIIVATRRHSMPVQVYEMLFSALGLWALAQRFGTKGKVTGLEPQSSDASMSAS